ncbi:hypothetical protein ED551_03025 [Muribaculaceae bacterium Isolate-013 (NCI)]|nr:hypothetical protein ED551_03025 [Muribaculaceae bacterium Isolate-013 (NCI)]
MKRTGKDDIAFVAKHYRRGSFDSRTAWRRLNPAPGTGWRRIRVAAAVAAVIAAGATAAFIYNGNRPEAAPQEGTKVAVTAPAALRAVKVIDFDDAPLTDVAARIEEVYGVKVTNLPGDAAGYRLTLRYEGSAPDLVATVNELLGTEMEVECDDF